MKENGLNEGEKLMNIFIPKLSMRIILVLMLSYLLTVTQVVSAGVWDVGAQYTCGIQNDNILVCSGSGAAGRPPSNTFFSQVSAGYLHNCGIKTDNTVTCWTRDIKKAPEATPPGGTFSQISAGGYHTCGIRFDDNTVICWGNNNYGQATPPNDLFSHISAGRWHTCGIRTDNTVVCWGLNRYGQATPPEGTFLQVDAAMAGWHTCGVRTDNTIVCWGDNSDGQATPPSGTFHQVSAGKWYSCGIRTDKTVTCWGNNTDGQATPPSGSFSSIRAAMFHTCGVKPNNTMACWGYNGHGSMGPAGMVVKSSGPPTVCFLYAVPDNGLLLTIDSDTFEVSTLGKHRPKTPGIQTMDFHPLTNQLYAVSSKGILYHVNSTFTDLGNLGKNFRDVDGLSFHPDGTLWGWASKNGLFQINNNKDEPNPQKVKVILSYSGEVEIEDITWDNGGAIIYGVENLYEKPIPENTDESSSDNFKGARLYAYDNGSKSVSVVCNELMGSLKTEVSALDTLPDNRLLFGFRKKAGLSFSVINVERCEMMTEIEAPSDYNEIKSIAWPHNCDLP